MTDKDPGGYSQDDPIAHLEFDTPTEVVTENGERWMAVSMDTELRAFLDCFCDHIATLDELFGQLDDTDEDKLDEYILTLQKLIAKDLEKLQLLTGDWIQFRGLPHFVFDQDMYGVDDDAIVTGQFLGGMTFPHLEYGDSGIVTALPVGAHFAVANISTVTGDGGESTNYGSTDENPAVVTLHGQNIKLSRLIPVYDTGTTNPNAGPELN